MRSEIANQPVARIGAEAELEGVARRLSDAALVEILSGGLSGGGCERIAVKLRRRAVGAQNGVRLGAPVGRPKLHPRALRQLAERVAKLHILRAHHEAENVAPGGTRAEAAPRLPLRAHHERRRPLRVKRAVGFVSIPGLLQRDARGYYVDDVELGFDFVYRIHGEVTARMSARGVVDGDSSMSSVRAIGRI